jgi:hypothetical protein
VNSVLGTEKFVLDDVSASLDISHMEETLVAATFHMIVSKVL